jgi:DNA-directed RNA polymerase subunit RPC12/RpoP
MIQVMQALEFAAIELRIACPRCGASVPIDTVTPSVVCEQCQYQVMLNVEMWRAALGGVDQDVVRFGRGYLRPGPPPDPTIGCRVDWLRGRAEPTCRRCGGRTRVDVERNACVCAACGEAREIEAAPDWLTLIVPWVIGYVSDPPPAERPREPIGITCTQCGAPMLADGTARLVRCEYCKVQNVLPDAVWAALHPPRVPRRFWVLVHLPHDPRQELPMFPSPLAEAIAVATKSLSRAMPSLAISCVVVALLALIGLIDSETVDAIAWGAACVAALGGPIGFFVIYMMQKASVDRLRRICSHENEIVGRLGAYDPSSTKVVLTPPGRPDVVLGETSVWLSGEDYARLGGEGTPVRAFMVPERPDLREIKLMPSALE